MNISKKLDEAVMEGKQELIDILIPEKFRLMDRLQEIEDLSIRSQI